MRKTLIERLVILCNFIFIFLIFIVAFILMNQLTILNGYLDKIKDDSFYVYNYNNDKLKYDENTINNRALYSFDYIEINNEYYSIIYLNDKALNYGVPILYNDLFLMVDINGENFEKNIIYTNVFDFETSDIKYLNYLENRTIKSYFINCDIYIPFICLTDDISNFSLGIYDTIPQNTNESWFNDIWDNSMCVEGSYMKDAFFYANSLYMKIFVSLSIVPILFLMFATSNLYSYYISKNHDNIIIEHIYYLSNKRLIHKYFFKLFIPTLITSFIAVVIAWLVVLRYDFSIVLLSLLICTIIQALVIHIICKIAVNKNIKYNLWREIND